MASIIPDEPVAGAAAVHTRDLRLSWRTESRCAVNVLTSRKSGATVSAMLNDPRVRKLSFTGSTEVGRILLREAAETIVNCSMELGGNAPFIIFDDADAPAGAAILGTEIFGPVAPVVRFTDEADAVRWANDTEFGLVSYVYTRDLSRGLRCRRRSKRA